MSEAWDRLITEMIGCMIREFLSHPAELLTFRRLAKLVASDHDVLHAIAQTRRDLFMITEDDRFIKLFPEAVEGIVHVGLERTIGEIGPPVVADHSKHDHTLCSHFSSDEEILADLQRCSFHPSALVRACC